MSHARLSPSSFHRAQACPGSVREEAKFPDTDNEHSLRGTAAHQVAEFCLSDSEDPKEYLGQEITVFKTDGSKYPVKMVQEDIDAVAAYVDYVKLRIEQLGPHVTVSLEKKVNPGTWLGRADLWGTLDCNLIQWDCDPSLSGAKILLIETIDYKHGYNPVEPEHNSQPILYSIGECSEHDWSQSDQTETIKMTIVQPRAPHIRGPVRSWEIPAYELFGMLEQLRLQAAATDDPDAPLNPGEKQCKWCKAKATCPALQAQAAAVFAPATELGPGPVTMPPAPTLSWEDNLLRPVEVMDTAALVKALDNEALVTGWFKSIRDHLTKLALEGQQVPNYKLVHAQTRRKWGVADEDLIKKLMGLRDISDKDNPRKIKKAEVTEVKPLSISQCEKRVRPLVSERQWKGIQALIIKPEGAPVLAPLTDPREPIKRAEDVFEPVNKEQPAIEPPGW